MSFPCLELWVLVRNGLSHTFKHLHSKVLRQKEKYYNSKAKGGEKKKRSACSLLILPIVLYNISRLLHMQTNHNIFHPWEFRPSPSSILCLSFSRASTAHAAADSALPGFMFCVLSGQRIPQRSGGIVDTDLPKKSHKKELN